MKTKILNKILILIILTFIFYNCRSNYPNSVSLNDTICLNYANKKEPLLNVELVHTMVKGYKNHQLRVLNNNAQIDAHSVLFNIETLKNFIYQIEINATKNKQNTADLGVRIYYANYPKRATWNSSKFKDLIDLNNNPITQQYEFKHTVVMIPTLKRKGIHYDFNPMDINTYTTELTNIISYSNPEFNSVFSTMALAPTSPSNGTNAQNHGSLIPPGTDGGEAFFR